MVYWFEDHCSECGIEIETDVDGKPVGEGINIQVCNKCEKICCFPSCYHTHEKIHKNRNVLIL